MGLFKADFYRFFALGFAGGALLVLGAMGVGHHSLAAPMPIWATWLMRIIITNIRATTL